MFDCVYVVSIQIDSFCLQKMEEGDDEAAAAEMDGEVLTKEAEVEALADAQKRIFLDVLMVSARGLTQTGCLCRLYREKRRIPSFVQPGKVRFHSVPIS